MMKRRAEIFEYTYWGIAAVTVAATSLIWVDDFWGSNNWLYRYQTLITGGLAVIAAIFLYRAAIRQIEETRAQAEDARKRAALKDNCRTAGHLKTLLIDLQKQTDAARKLFNLNANWNDSGDLEVISVLGDEYDPKAIDLSKDFNFTVGEVRAACVAAHKATARLANSSAEIFDLLSRYKSGDLDLDWVDCRDEVSEQEMRVRIAVCDVIYRFLELNVWMFEQSTDENAELRRLRKTVWSNLPLIEGDSVIEIQQAVELVTFPQVRIFE